MGMRIRIGLIGVAVYLVVMFLLGEKAQGRAVVRNRLAQIEASGKFGIEDEALKRSFGDRIFLPVYNRLVRLIGTILPVSGKAQAQLEEKLRKAGKKMPAREYLAKQAVYMLFFAAAVYLVARLALHTAPGVCTVAVLYACIGYYVAARFLLGKQITGRKESIENEMPEILDLLSVSVSAGLGFDQALQYVTDRCKGPFSDELAVTQREIKLGRARNDALKNLAERCEVEALKVFVSAVIQADTLGIAVANVLQVQADNVRQMHRQKVEEKAAKLPVKILIPLVFCIFPVMFIILIGPAIPNVIEAFANM